MSGWAVEPLGAQCPRCRAALLVVVTTRGALMSLDAVQPEGGGHMVPLPSARETSRGFLPEVRFARIAERGGWSSHLGTCSDGGRRSPAQKAKPVSGRLPL